MSRSDIVVEGRASAQRENGNLHTFFTEADWQNNPPAGAVSYTHLDVYKRQVLPVLGCAMSHFIEVDPDFKSTEYLAGEKTAFPKGTQYD